MRTLSREAEAKIEIQRSRFIGRSFLVASPGEGLAAVRILREKNRDASHHAWAYRTGPAGEQARYSDDGEPQGTAGPPILDILKSAGVTNTLIIVTRYFGGVKLGAGGLVRAYGEAARLVLDASRPRELRLMREFEAAVPYPLLGALERHLEAGAGEIEARDFGGDVRLRFWLPVGEAPAFETFFAGLTGGRSAAVVLGEKYR